jgi:Mitochondrial ribosomal protein (VAR1)
MTFKEWNDNKEFINLSIKNLTKTIKPKIKNIKNISLNKKNSLNKDYNKKLINISNKQHISIYLKGLNSINKHLNNIISNWKGNKLNLFKLINNLNNKTTKNIDLLSSNNLNTKNKLNKTIFPLTYLNSNNLNTNTKLSDYNYLIKLNKKNTAYSSINSKINSTNLNSNTIINIQNYIKNMTHFNAKSAYSFSRNYNYKFNTSITTNNKLTNNIYLFIDSAFYSMSFLISKPIFSITPEKVIIQLFYYNLSFFKQIKKMKWKNKLINIRDTNSILNKHINNLKLKIISQKLAHYFKKPVEFELIKSNNPYFNANILVQLLGLIINKTKLRKIKNNIFKGAKTIKANSFLNSTYSNIPSYLAGIKIRVAGRLLTQRVVPRKTVKLINKGALARSKVIFLDSSRFTNKNKRGAFSITVFTGYVKI